MKALTLTFLIGLTSILPVKGESSAFRVISFDPISNPVTPSDELIKFQFAYQGRADYAILEPTELKTWVVFFHSFGGDAFELYKSPLLHPQWIDMIRASGFGLVSFETYGNSWMAPFTADAIHQALEVIREKYQVNHFIFVGASMGGSAVLAYSVRYPSDVFAALAMCPASDIGSYYESLPTNPKPTAASIMSSIEEFYGNTASLRENGFNSSSAQKNSEKLVMPLVIAHGTDDSSIPVSQSDELAARLQDKTDFKYFRYSGGDHYHPSIQGFRDSWPWLMEQIKYESHP